MKTFGREHWLHIAIAIADFVAAMVGYFIEKTGLPDAVTIGISRKYAIKERTLERI